jgi:hypothetical protein
LYCRVKKSIFWARWVQSTSSHLPSSISIHVCLSLPRGDGTAPEHTTFSVSRAQIVAFHTNNWFAEWEPGSRYLYSWGQILACMVCG